MTEQRTRQQKDNLAAELAELAKQKEWLEAQRAGRRRMRMNTTMDAYLEHVPEPPGRWELFKRFLRGK